MKDLAADLRHMTATWDENAFVLLRRSLPRVLLQGRFRGIVLFRASQWAYRHRLRFLAYWLQSRVLRACGADLDPAARIGPGLCLVHSVGIVVGHKVRAGRELVLYQSVTLGHGKDFGGQPHLGDRCRIYAGAVVLGDLEVGDDAVIGAGALVLADVPRGTTVVGRWTSPRSVD